MPPGMKDIAAQERRDRPVFTASAAGAASAVMLHPGRRRPSLASAGTASLSIEQEKECI